MLGLGVARTGQSVHIPPLPTRHLCDDMSRRAKTVDAEFAAVASHHQGAPADQAGAEQRCKLRVLAVFTERKAVTRVCHQVGGKAAVPRITGEQWIIAEIFLTLPAIRAVPAGRPEPGNANARTKLRAAYAVTNRVDAADHFVPGNDRIGNVWQFSVDDVQIGAANAAGADFHADLAGTRDWVRPLHLLQRRAARGQDHGVHTETRFSSMTIL